MTKPTNKTGRGRLMPPTAGTGGVRKLVQLGRPPQEAGHFGDENSPKTYPPEVRARLDADADEIIARYPQPRSAILSLLHLVQAEDSHLSPAGVEFCAERLGMTNADVAGVASFYSMFRRTPTGEYLVSVCTNTLCAVMGGDAIFEALKEHLGVDNEQTTPDGSITLQHVECNAACDYAPVMMVNWEFFDKQTPESARIVVDALRAGDPVIPSRGGPLSSFRHTERILAGFYDPESADGGAAAGEAPGDPTLAGLRVAQQHGMQAPAAPTTPEGGTS